MEAVVGGINWANPVPETASICNPSSESVCLGLPPQLAAVTYWE